MYPTNSHLYNHFTNYIDISLFILLVIINSAFIENLKPILKPYTSTSNPWKACITGISSAYFCDCFNIVSASTVCGK